MMWQLAKVAGVSIPPRLKKFANLEVALWVSLAAWQVYYRLYTFVADYDRVMQVASGLNFFSGHELGHHIVANGDLSRPSPDFLSQWPPGYALLFDAFLLFFRRAYAAMLATDVLAVALFFVGCASLCWRIRDRLTPDARIAFVLVAGLVGFPSYLQSDLFAVSVMIIALGLLIPSPGRAEVPDASVAVAGFLFALLHPFRYAYVLVSVAPLSVLIWEARKDLRAWYRVELFFMAWLVPTLPFLWWKFFYVRTMVPGSFHGVGTALSNIKNLIWTYPFGSDALTGNRFVNRFPQFGLWSAPGFSVWMFLLRHLLSGALIWAAVMGYRGSVEESGEPARARAFRRLSRLALVLSVSVASLLVAMTVLQPARRDVKFMLNPVGRALWVEGVRYWMPITPLILVGLFLACSREPRLRSQRAARTLVMVSLGAAATLWGIVLPRDIARVRHGHVGGPLSRYYSDQQPLNEFLVRKTRPGMPNVVALIGPPTDATYIRVAVATIAGWGSARVRGADVIKTSRPVNLVAFLEPAAEPQDVRNFDDICSRMQASRETLDYAQICQGTLVR